MWRKSIYTALIVFVCATSGMTQSKQKPLNYSRFDHKVFHFGFMLGLNTADFSTRYKPNMMDEYNVYSIENKLQPGFQLGLIGSMKLGTPLLRLRFIPSISFQERILNYYTLSNDENKKYDVYEERIGSTNLDFPLLLKFRTLRYNNFAAYIIGGGQYTLDLQSKEKAAQKYGDPFVKIFRDDFQYQVGAGVDFFLTFFKFSIELKFSHGFKNAFIQDNTRLSNPIESLKNRVWLISFTFEG
ncbi:MAG TPA: porin family protein [Brumimicrobium sp.]|nr:porin family protein [Brumimicrobium sp.]